MLYYLIPRGRVVLEKARLCMRKSQVLRGQISTLRGERFRARFMRLSSVVKVYSIEFHIFE